MVNNNKATDKEVKDIILKYIINNSKVGKYVYGFFLGEVFGKDYINIIKELKEEGYAIKSKQNEVGETSYYIEAKDIVIAYGQTNISNIPRSRIFLYIIFIVIYLLIFFI